MSELEKGFSPIPAKESPETPSSTGRIVGWNIERGFGFVDQNGKQLFVHISDLPKGLIATVNGGVGIEGVELNIIKTEVSKTGARTDESIKECTEITPKNLLPFEVSEKDTQGWPYWFHHTWNAKNLRNRPSKLIEEVERRKNDYRKAPLELENTLHGQTYEELNYRLTESNRPVFTGYRRNREGVIAFIRGLNMMPWHDPSTNVLYAFCQEPPTDIGKVYGEDVLKIATEHGGFSRIQIVQSKPSVAYAITARGFGSPLLELEQKPISVDQHNIVRGEDPIIRGGQPIYWDKIDYKTLDVEAFPEDVRPLLTRLCQLILQQHACFEAHSSPIASRNEEAKSMPHPSRFEIEGLKAKVALKLFRISGIGCTAYGPGNPRGIDVNHVTFTDKLDEAIRQTEIAAELADKPIAEIRIDRRKVTLPDGNTILAKIGVIEYQNGTKVYRPVSGNIIDFSGIPGLDGRRRFMDMQLRPIEVDLTQEPPMQVTSDDPLYSSCLEQKRIHQEEAEKRAEKFTVLGTYLRYQGPYTNETEEKTGEVGQVLAFYEEDGTLSKLYFKPTVDTKLNPKFQEGEIELFHQVKEDTYNQSIPYLINDQDRYNNFVVVRIAGENFQITVKYAQQRGFYESKLYQALRMQEKKLQETAHNHPTADAQVVITEVAPEPSHTLEEQVIELQRTYDQAKQRHDFEVIQKISGKLHEARLALTHQRALSGLVEKRIFSDKIDYEKDSKLLINTVSEFIRWLNKIPRNNQLSETHLLRCALAAAGLKTALEQRFVEADDREGVSKFLQNTFKIYNKVDPNNPEAPDWEELVLTVDQG